MSGEINFEPFQKFITKTFTPHVKKWCSRGSCYQCPFSIETPICRLATFYAIAMDKFGLKDRIFLDGGVMI